MDKFLMFSFVIALYPSSPSDPPLVMLGSTKKPTEFTDTKKNTDMSFISDVKKKDSLNLLPTSNAYYDATKSAQVLEIKVNSATINSAIFMCSIFLYSDPKTEKLYGMLISIFGISCI